ncbi:hypothetical protein P170DRAFT_422996 [Aspergillus steynii IBT 23096]|uniref:Uncharacterized protein n=1 Tax=Aspergillus steynii IBT 23096 TaxID=1392250 RepID=A0A2I2GGX8_9EURO|nr:uncharacterized protein P170DRAFT_422996 [Aspergillus steynii IBT 23096]PLB52087.1 hypothetical protein P170DRAFT_422996 [Aspergillus steynii IBT 23096]
MRTNCLKHAIILARDQKAISHPHCLYLFQSLGHGMPTESTFPISQFARRFWAYADLSFSVPSPFLLGGSIGCGATCVQVTLEAAWENGHPSHPHVTMMIYRRFNGPEGSMLHSELVPIISAMRSRAYQPKVKEHEMDDLFEGKPFADKPRVFPKEKRFPVLLLSFVGPQHARIFYAYVEDGNKLIIRQRLADAPVELFARFPVGRPSF